MQLLTKELEKKLPKRFAQEDKRQKAICYAHYFCGVWDWYALEYNPTEKEFFGIVVGQETEYGYFSLVDLSTIRGTFGGVERDLHWEECEICEIDKLKDFLSNLREDEE